MDTLNRFPRLLCVVLLVLLSSAFLTIPAYADDEPPHAGTDAPVVTDSGDTSSDAGESQPTDASQTDPLPDPTQATESTPAPEEAMPDASPASEEAVTETVPAPEPFEPLPETDAPAAEELLDSIPEGTEVVVLDENGETVPLVTEEAAEILLTGDPIWCPASVAAPTPGMGGCTTSYATFAALLADPVFGAFGPATDGTIWVEKTYLGNDNATININGLTLVNTNMRNFKLTIKGGWNGAGTGTIDTSSPSQFDVQLNISNWNADVTISDITFNGSPSGGLSVTTTKNITVTRVTATSNTGTGGNFDNSGGTGNVTITSSKFNSNTNGLGIFSKGMITLSNIQASNNASGYGAFIDNSSASPAKTVTMTGENEFNNNDNGLQVYSKGAITLTDVTANGNGQLDNSGNGAILSNTFGANPGPGVTLNGTNIFNNNDDTGLSVYSYGPIKINNLFANSNDDSYGALLSNSSAATAQPVTLTGSSQFKYNSNGNGLEVVSRGVVTLNNITANNNGFFGAAIDNTYGSAVVSVNLTGSSTFNENQSDGLYVSSDGMITLSNITAYQNGLSGFGYGAYLENFTLGQKIALTGTNTFTENRSGGLYVSSNGPISLNNVTASGTTNGDGAELYNTAGGTSTPQTVTLTGTNVFSENREYGLLINTYGAVTLSNVTAEDNGFGTSVGGVSIINSGADPAKPASVTMTGTNKFNYNDNNGLSIFSIGTITLSNVTANSNGSGTYGSGVGGGVYLVNSGGVGKGVTLSGTNTFLYNYASGLYIDSKGAITLSSVTAQSNGGGAGGGNGAFLYNGSALSAQKVTMTGVNNFSYNYTHGLSIASTGAVSTNSVTAAGNGGGLSFGDGVVINNTYLAPASLQPVTMTGTNEFNGNYSNGLSITTYGAVSLNNLSADNNGSGTMAGGVYIANDGGPAPANVTLTGVNSFTYNKTDGLVIYSKGAITLSNVTANSNGQSVAGSGAVLDNGAGSAGVTLTGTNKFISNYTNGLYIFSKGAISVSSVTAQNNSHNKGVLLNNATAPTPKSVTLSGINLIGGNYSSGVEIYSLGAVTVNSISSSWNGSGASYGWGLYIDNNDSGAAGNVTLSGTNELFNNYFDGLYVESVGAVMVNNLTAYSNGLTATGYGAFIDNTLAASAKVAFTGTNEFDGNKSGGLRVNTNGAITSSLALLADYNGGDGIFLSNTTASPVQPVTLSGKVVVNYNDTDGLEVYSDGAITISNLTANGNGFPSAAFGAYLDNSSAPAPVGVTLLGTNSVNSNYGDGLQVNSDGLIKVNSLTATFNGTAALPGDGAELVNTSAGATGGVTLTGANTFTGNYESGLKIQSVGAITLNSVASSGNANGFGAHLNNTFSGSSTPQNVTLTGSNLFESNSKNTGLYISTYGAVAINNLTAQNNGNSSSSGYGAYISNYTGTIAKNVTLTGSNSFVNNYDSGLYVASLGSITVSNLTANDNDSYGAELWNNIGTSTGSVTISGFGTFNDNGSTGLVVVSFGKVTMNQVTAISNSGDGVTVNNSGAASPQAVAITGVNTFRENSSDGLYVTSLGAITLNSVTAIDNFGGYGAYLNNAGGAGANVTVSGVNTFLANNATGLYILASGSVSVTKSTSDGNNGYGVYVNTTTGNVTITCGSYTNNSLNGLRVDGGAGASVLTITGVVAAGNFTSPDVQTLFWTGSTPITVRNCPLP